MALFEISRIYHVLYQCTLLSEKYRTTNKTVKQSIIIIMFTIVHFDDHIFLCPKFYTSLCLTEMSVLQADYIFD